MSNQNSDKTIDQINELLPGLYEESDGRIDLLVDIMQSRLSELCEVRNQLSDVGLNNSLLEKKLIEMDQEIEIIRFLDKKGYIKGQVELDKIKPDAELGKKHRAQQKEFSQVRNKERSDERQKEWLKWNNEAQRLIKLNPALENNKSDLARKVIVNLDLSDSFNTVRRYII